MSTVTEKDLRTELEDIRERFPKLKDDELFVAWFMKCFVTDTEAEGTKSLVGGAKDKNIDAIHVDDASRSVVIVQGKYRLRPNGSSEKRSDVLAFAHLAVCFTDDEAFATYRTDLAPEVLGKAEEARKRIKHRDYRLQLYFVTMGKCSPALSKEASSVVRQSTVGAEIDIVDGKRVLRLLADYLDGVAPPVPLLEIELEQGQGITLDGVLQRYDQKTHIASWVVPVAVDQIGRMYEAAGIRLFARNVRGFLGDNTPINRNMRKTLESEPDNFWYYNNGVTIVCDEAERVKRGGSDVMRMVNPQIINGQQTTRTLHAAASKSTRATVLVRVISVPRDTPEGAERFEKLVTRVVAATNWQNAIRASDLMANDRLQIQLERNLRKIDYQYLRKRQSKGEARRHAGVKHRFAVSKEELAQVVAASDLDPLVVREGKEQLFEERYYSTVFPRSDTTYYLPRYWLGRHIAKRTKGFPERAYAKWLVLHFLWQRLGPFLANRAQRDLFRVKSEHQLFAGLMRAADAVFRATSAYYRSNRGSGATQTDPSTFFKRADHHKALEQFWSTPKNKHRSAFQRAWRHFTEEFHNAAEQ